MATSKMERDKSIDKLQVYKTSLVTLQIDENGNASVGSFIPYGALPIFFLGDSDTNQVIFWDGSSATGFQPTAYFLSRRSKSISGYIVYLHT